MLSKKKKQMELLKKHWKTIVIGVLLILIGVILARSCSKHPETSHQVSIDSLQNASTVTQAIAERKSDSLRGIIVKQEKQALELTKSIQAITAKYKILINRTPDKDTVVTYREVYVGKECLEKLPIIQAQLDNCNAKVENYQQLVIVKTNQNIALQKDFNRALAISKDQEKDLKKLNKKNGWLKKVVAGVAIVGLAGVIYGIAK
jgi:hypothetical protein